MDKVSNCEILCFVCDKYFPFNQLQNHVNKCKVIFETQNKVHLVIPDVYPILYDASNPECFLMRMKRKTSIE